MKHSVSNYLSTEQCRFFVKIGYALKNIKLISFLAWRNRNNHPYRTRDDQSGMELRTDTRHSLALRELYFFVSSLVLTTDCTVGKKLCQQLKTASLEFLPVAWARRCFLGRLQTYLHPVRNLVRLQVRSGDPRSPAGFPHFTPLVWLPYICL